MQSPDFNQDWTSIVAAAADVCFKPWRHAVIVIGSDEFLQKDGERDLDVFNAISTDLIARIECRDQEGSRYPEKDLELEIYSSGKDLNLLLSWLDQPERPILWQGQHPVWMDGKTGKRCSAPNDGAPLEALARRLRALFVSTEEN